jgi:Na+-driven multidrug efflux pump
LKKEDHYILVMCAQAFGQDSALGSEHQGRNYLIFVVVISIAFALFWLTKHVVN